MKKLLRWGGLAISIGTYVALTIWANTFAGETAISRGESATQSGMRPFWILIYIGIAMLIASWLVPRGERDRRASTDEAGGKYDPEPLKSSSLLERPYEELSPEALRRAVQNLRDEARTGNLRPRKQPDSAEDSQEQ